MRQRRRRNASRKLGRSSSVSARALISFVPTARSFAQGGTSPQRSMAGVGTPSTSRTARISCVGAILKRGKIGSRVVQPQSATRRSPSTISVKRPHMGESCAEAGPVRNGGTVSRFRRRPLPEIAVPPCHVPLLLAAAMLAAFAAPVPGQDARPAPPAPALPGGELIGLWAVDTAFGPAARGELVLSREGAGWRASIGAHSANFPARGDSVRFTLPDGSGEFRGALIAGKGVSGFWIQPAGPATGQAYATPVTLRPAGRDRWRGSVTPLDERFTVYLAVARRQDGSLVGVFRNP